MKSGSKPTVWDGDMATKYLDFCNNIMFRAHRVGWRHVRTSSKVFWSLCSEPTVWDGDPLVLSIRDKFPCSEPTVWDGDHSLSLHVSED